MAPAIGQTQKPGAKQVTWRSENQSRVDAETRKDAVHRVGERRQLVFATIPHPAPVCSASSHH